MKVDKYLVAIVTGGASGLGAGICKKLSSLGCKVVIADINTKQGEVLSSELKDSTFIQTDVSSEDSIKNLITKTVQKFGAIHILVNCAGVKNYKDMITTEEYHKVFGVNVFGTLILSKYCFLQMKTQNYLNDFKERGVIINISSIQGIEGTGPKTIYAASKGAINGMTLPMARSFGKFGVRVCSIAPGAFFTPLLDDYNEETKKNIVKETPLERFGKPEEIADFIVGIAENTYLTGVVVRLDGGMILPPRF